MANTLINILSFNFPLSEAIEKGRIYYGLTSGKTEIEGLLILSIIWMERLRFILGQYWRTDTIREWLDTTFTTRTCRETVNGSRVVQLVNCIDIYLLQLMISILPNSYDLWMAGETNMLRTMHVLRSENVNAPKRKTRRIFFVLKAWEPESPSNDMHFKNCTTCKPLFHDPYESWTCIYTLSLANDIHFTDCTTRKPFFHDQYASYESNGSC